MSTNTRTIKVGYLARVEGEGSLQIKIKDNIVRDARLTIFEPPRFFEAFLRGRSYSEAPDITARICGICPVAYQMSAVHAMENALGLTVEEPIRALRRLIYCGEWIESHALHVYLLHAPDFLGYQDAIRMAQDHPEIVRQGLELKKIGNELVTLIGGREIHPINVRVGGFYRVPKKRELRDIEEKLKRARDLSIETVKLAGTFSFPEFEPSYRFVALRHEKEYPFNEGKLVSNSGLNIPIQEYDKHFQEEHVRHSNALQSVMTDGTPYFVGPLARYSLNFDRLPASAQDAALGAGLDRTCFNPFKSIVVRAVELVFACEEALAIIAGYEEPDAPYQEAEPRVATGYGCTEAPRGILYHRYHLNAEGLIESATIIPPTSQNQRRIEEDLRLFVSSRMNLSQEELTWQCEQAIRNYDPCISCATHFLALQIDRE